MSGEREIRGAAGGAADDASFTSEEIALLRDDRFFRVREQMVERVRRAFERLRERLHLHLAGGTYLMPPSASLRESRYGRGEHLDEMPYAFLDCPSYFDRESFFTFRTLFWWGHEMSFTLLLAGEHLPEYRQRLIRNLGILEALEVHVSTADTPWDWARGPGHTMRLAAGEEGTLLRIFRLQSFLKCTRYLEFEEAEFRENRIDEAALLTFRAFEPIILA